MLWACLVCLVCVLFSVVCLVLGSRGGEGGGIVFRRNSAISTYPPST